MRYLKSVKFLLTVWYLLILAALLFFFASVAYLLMSNDLNENLDDSLRVTATHIQAAIEIENGVPILKDNGDFLFSAQSLQLLGLFETSGRQLQSYGDSFQIPDFEAVLNRVLSGDSVYATMYQINEKPIRLFLVPVRDGYAVAGMVVAGRSTESIATMLDRLANIHVIGGFFTLILAGVGGLFLANRAFKPLEEMTRTAREIEETDLSRRIEVHSDDEMGVLGTTLNQMIARLQQAFTRQRQFTSDASHEMRTPLAIIQAEATLALSKERKAAEYRKSLKLINHEAEHMSGLIDRLLFIARSETARKPINLESVNLNILIMDLISEITPICVQRGLTCQFDHGEEVFVRGDSLDLRRLFLNLLDNAIRYTPQGGKISICMRLDMHGVVIKVTDTGIGIPEEHLGYIFDRFYRVDKARDKAEGGAGLGLPICKQIAEAHNGRIEVTSVLGKSSTFIVFLPIVKPIDQATPFN